MRVLRVPPSNYRARFIDGARSARAERNRRAS
jgi:hypothetical protein